MYKNWQLFVENLVSTDTGSRNACSVPTSHTYLIYIVMNLCLTLTLLEPKVISLCHQNRARPASTSMQSNQALYWYCWLYNEQVFFLKKWRWTSPFKKFSRLRVKPTKQSSFVLLYYFFFCYHQIKMERFIHLYSTMRELHSIL